MTQHAREIAITTDEARRIYGEQVDSWIEQLSKLDLEGGSFCVISSGRPNAINVSIDVGIFWSLLEARGCEVVSHSQQMVAIPKMVALGSSPQVQETTVTSLLVRLPKRDN